MNQPLPKSAFIAVTLLCNSKCVMCDIWQNKGLDFLPLSVYEKLPSSLEMIDITGGEPFLRDDLPQIVRVLKKTCPKARLLITTHGFMTAKIKAQVGDILREDPRIAFRVSVDGIGKVHEEIRRIPQAFDKINETLEVLKTAGVKDLGIIFTLMKQNQDQMRDVYEFAQELGVDFTANAVHDSPVYFGEDKHQMAADPKAVEDDFGYIFWKMLSVPTPKRIAKSWFAGQLLEYMRKPVRPLACGAGEYFFYMDSKANIYLCNFKSWVAGNIQEVSFEEVWNSALKMKHLESARKCQDCWSVCTVKDAVKAQPWKALPSFPKLMFKSAFH